MSSSFIFSAACISVASAEISSMFAVIMSRSIMVNLLVFWLSVSIHVRSAALRLRRPDEFQDFGVNDLSVGRAHAVGELREDLQRAFLEELCGKWRGIGNGDDLIVVPMQHQRRHVDGLQVF